MNDENKEITPTLLGEAYEDVAGFCESGSVCSSRDVSETHGEIKRSALARAERIKAMMENGRKRCFCCLFVGFACYFAFCFIFSGD